MVDYTNGWPKKIDCFIVKKFVFKVGIKISKWNSYTSLTVQRMTNDPVILDKFSAYRSAQVLCFLPPYIDLQSGQTFLNFKLGHFVPMQESLKHYVDAEASASIETPITGKRSATVLCDDGQSSEDFALISEATNKKNKM
ncbi:uncharacterized protein G2W53_010456 [Senna tora]|uniref:Uncharacterized protein n=1 Tax=Senna tora TaxID=362788 RepID=A0A834WZN8_9FABA|nr:uncharacterized protein G2W53_010456 [Senna tora]